MSTKFIDNGVIAPRLPSPDGAGAILGDILIMRFWDFLGRPRQIGRTPRGAGLRPDSSVARGLRETERLEASGECQTGDSDRVGEVSNDGDFVEVQY